SESSVITYADHGTRRIFAFVNSSLSRFFANHWKGSAPWEWLDRGVPTGTRLTGAPGAITYDESGVRKIYAFLCEENGNLFVNYWDGSSWQWADQGKLNA